MQGDLQLFTFIYQQIYFLQITPLLSVYEGFLVTLFVCFSG